MIAMPGSALDPVGATRVTVALIPREGFARASVTLEEVVASIGPDVPLVIVESGAPEGVRRHLDGVATQRALIRLGGTRYLSPNEARNLAFMAVDTEYVVFIDNDVHPAPGWLEALVACADETDAWVVGPLVGMPPLDDPTVHVAGGTSHVATRSGRRVFEDEPGHANESVALVAPTLVRARTEVAEFHCMLVRSDRLRSIGPLDEGLLSLWEHSDLCMAVRAAGGEVWLEPKALVVLVRTYDRANLMLSLLRWSRAWNLQSARHFSTKHDISDPRVHRGTFRYAERRRYRAFCDATGLPAPFAPVADVLAAVAARRDRRDRRRTANTHPRSGIRPIDAPARD
jgi:glycosyltransferase involved in cell wall biosynthesis